jgi:hypothetical protein
MNEDQLKWWDANLGHITRLSDQTALRLGYVLNIGGIKKAEEFLWDEILRLEDWPMTRGIGKLVYVEDYENHLKDEE